MTTVVGKNAESYEHERIEHTPWVEKYRPKTLEDVASQDNAVKVLKKTVQTSNLPHMLFYGPPGTGKTSTILALAKELYGPNLIKSRVLELNASDERGISIVRQKIKNFARLAVSNPSKEDLQNYPCPPYKIIILDEADSMTNDAQSALRRTMENYSNVTRFCLICNYITRIIDPIASRCSKFRFKPLNNENALERLQYISQQEQITLNQNENVLEEVLRISNGDLRKAITFLQSASKLQSSLSSPRDEDDMEIEQDTNGVSVELVHEIAGIVSSSVIENIVKSIKSKNNGLIISDVRESIFEGWSVQQFLGQLHDEFILNDQLSSYTKNKMAEVFYSTDRKLTNGTDEHIQLLNLCLQLSSII